jgi:hypothetical protein
MAHVGHRQHWTRVERGHGGAQSGSHGERAGGVAGPIHRLREDGVGLGGGGLDDHVVGFRHRDAELIHRHGMHRQPVGRHHRHGQPRDADVEVRHRRPVDDPQAHAFARREQAGPVGGRWQAVHQVGVGGAGDIGEVGGAHPHPRPLAAFGERRAQPVATDIAQEGAERALPEVVGVGLLLEGAEDTPRVLVRPVGQHHHVLAVVGERLALTRLDDQRAIDAALFLEARVAVVPVGAALPRREPIVVASRRDGCPRS